MTTNSFHHQGVQPDNLAPGLRAFAWCDDDGLVEAAVHNVFPILAVQWHPERNGQSEDLDSMLLKRLIRDGAFWK